jgi:outer membrane protein assembly factor BamB
MRRLIITALLAACAAPLAAEWLHSRPNDSSVAPVLRQAQGRPERSRGAASLAVARMQARASEGWPQWRGERRDGAAVSFKVPSVWPQQLTRIWSREVGVGHSSPIVAGGRVFQLARLGEEEVLRALEIATGKVIWEQKYPAPYTMNPAAMGHGKGPKSTPVWSQGRVFTLGISGILSAFDAASGKLLWRHEFAKEFPQTSPLYGAAMSPVVIDGGVVVHVGGPGRGALASFDGASGRMNWAWRGDGPGYASPVLLNASDGVRQLVTQTERHLIGVNASDGTLLWQVPFTTEYDQNAITPIVDGHVVIYSGLDKGMTATRIVKRGTEWKPEQVWHSAEPSLYLSPPVLHAGVIYGLGRRNRGHFFAMDAATGKVLWTTEGRQGENAAIVRAADTILALTTDSDLVAFGASREGFKPLARYDVAPTPTWAHPALVADGILIKDENTLSLWRL